MKRYILHLIIVAVLTGLVLPAGAQILGRGFGGALGGAALGSLVGGRKSAQAGAIIGGTIGVIRGAGERSRKQAEAEAHQRQEAERQRIAQKQQQAEIERLKAQQAAQTAPPVNAAPASPGADTTLVVEVQKSLIRLGYDPGAVDGKLSPSTVSAIKQYQAKKGLLEDGNPSQVLLVHMLRNGG